MLNNNMYFTQLEILWKIFSETPTVVAHIRGSMEYPDLKGIAHFYQTTDKVLVLVEMMNLPSDRGIDAGRIEIELEKIYEYKDGVMIKFLGGTLHESYEEPFLTLDIEVACPEK